MIHVRSAPLCGALGAASQANPARFMFDSLLAAL